MTPRQRSKRRAQRWRDKRHLRAGRDRWVEAVVREIKAGNEALSAWRLSTKPSRDWWEASA